MFDEFSSMNDLIAAARQRSEALGILMQRYRGYLRLIAEREIGAQLGRRADASDVVQQTFLKAHRAFEQFRGRSEPELTGWLVVNLRNTIKDLVREHVLTEKRALKKEVSLEQDDGTASIVIIDPQAHQSSPSQRMIRGERAIRLAEVVDTLPTDQRTAVRLRFLEGWSLDDTAKYMDRSPSAIAGLEKRGLAALNRRMSEQSWV